MRYPDLNSFLRTNQLAKAKGPIGLIFVEDLIEVDSTIRHHLDQGFAEIILFAPIELNLPRDLTESLTRVDYNYTKTKAHEQINMVIKAAPGSWIYYCYNAEYLFFPFCETRSIKDMTTFLSEERRDSALCYVIDLYADDLAKFETGVRRDRAMMDKSGYYALARPDPVTDVHRDRQLDFFGGLRWRFEEHVSVSKRRIDRVGVFRAVAGLEITEDHRFNIQEYNTYACEWHNNLTAAICSFRTAKALKLNPGSTFEIDDFQWHGSTQFKWDSQQLMDLGLMEPGQWF